MDVILPPLHNCTGSSGGTPTTWPELEHSDINQVLQTCKFPTTQASVSDNAIGNRFRLMGCDNVVSSLDQFMPRKFLAFVHVLGDQEERC